MKNQYLLIAIISTSAFAGPIVQGKDITGDGGLTMLQASIGSNGISTDAGVTTTGSVKSNFGSGGVATDGGITQWGTGGVAAYGGLTTISGAAAPGSDRVNTALICLNGACTEGWSAAAGINTTGATAGGVAYGNGSKIAFTAAGTSGKAVISGGAGSPTIGTLGVSGGGTNGTATPTAGGVAYGTGTAYAFTNVGSPGQCLFSAGASQPTWDDCLTAGEHLWGARCTTCAVDNNMGGPYQPAATRAIRDIDCSWETAGTVGSSNATVQVYDVTSSASVCTCSIGACNTAPNVPMNCSCGGTLTLGHKNAIRISSKGDCTVAPQIITCNAHVDI